MRRSKDYSSSFSQNLNGNELIISLIINIILFSFVFLIFTPMFETNDDFAMMQISAGRRYGEPSEYLVFINVILGLFLKILYQNFTSINWYVIIFYSIHFFSMTAILYVFLKQSRAIYNIILYLILFTFFEVFFLANLQFTTTSIVAGCGGLFLLLQIANNKRKIPWTMQIGGILLFVASSWVRFRIFPLLFLLFFPIVLLLTINTRKVKLLILFSLSAILILGTYVFHNNYYNRDPAWQYYRKYNSLRPIITDHKYAQYSEKTMDVYQTVGWSENDVNLFRSWVSFDQTIYSIDDLEYITSRISPFDQDISDILETIERAYDSTAPRRLWLLLITAIISISFVRKKDKLLVLTELFLAFVAFLLLSFIARLPIRVINSILFSTNLFLFYLLSNEENHIHHGFYIISHRRSFITTGTIFLLVLLGSVIRLEYQYNTSRLEEETEAATDYITQELSSHDYIYAIAAGIFQNLDLQISIRNDFNQEFDDVYLGGWFVPSPIHNHEISQYGIEATFPSLLREDILIVARPQILRMIVTSMVENYQLYLNFDPVLEVNDISAYTLTRTAKPIEPFFRITERNPIFHWAPIDEATSYQVQVRQENILIENKTVKSLEEVCSDTVCIKQFDLNIPVGDYRWRVRANENGEWQPWSIFIDFSIIQN